MIGKFLAGIEPWLRRHFRFKEIGWDEIGETFTRFIIVDTPWFSIYLHKLDAPVLHEQCHDHPWHFWAVVLDGGYAEHTANGVAWRGPGSILYRHAKFAHNVVTNGVGWSAIVASRKIRAWGFLDCEAKR